MSRRTPIAVPPRAVTDSRGGRPAGAPSDAATRDCAKCGEAITGAVCIYERRGNEPQRFTPYCEGCAAQLNRRHDERQWDWWTDDGEAPDFAQRHNVNAPDYDPFHGEQWEPKPCDVCGQLVRGHSRGAYIACSQECQSRLPATAARRRRRRMREAVTPDHFDCIKCEREIEGTIIFWWKPDPLSPWCESCFVAQGIEDHGRTVEKYGPSGPLGIFGEDHDPETFDPLARLEEAHPCGHCGRLIRGAEFCCDRCDYEAAKAARRVEHIERKCKVCGEAFTLKRSDAKTCSDKCRQALRRSKSKPTKRVTAKRVTAPRARATAAASRDNGEAG